MRAVQPDEYVDFRDFSFYFSVFMDDLRRIRIYGGTDSFRVCIVEKIYP